MNATVKINSNTEMFSARLSDSGNALEYCIYFVIGIYHLKFFCCIHLNCFESGIFLFKCGFSYVARAITSDP